MFFYPLNTISNFIIFHPSLFLAPIRCFAPQHLRFDLIPLFTNLIFDLLSQFCNHVTTINIYQGSNEIQDRKMHGTHMSHSANMSSTIIRFQKAKTPYILVVEMKNSWGLSTKQGTLENMVIQGKLVNNQRNKSFSRQISKYSARFKRLQNFH